MTTWTVDNSIETGIWFKQPIYRMKFTFTQQSNHFPFLHCTSIFGSCNALINNNLNRFALLAYAMNINREKVTVSISVNKMHWLLTWFHCRNIISNMWYFARYIQSTFIIQFSAIWISEESKRCKEWTLELNFVG